MLTANIEGIDETYAEYKIKDLLPRINCPVLIIQGNPALGSLMRDEDVKKALRLMPQARHISLKRAGHYLQMQDKESLRDAVVPFLDSLTTNSL